MQYTAVVNADVADCETHCDVLCGNLNSYAAVDFRDSTAVGSLVYGE
jgi:hypothetical protein